MRFGRLSEQNKTLLVALSREVKYTDSVEPTELFPTKREVQFANESRLAKLSGPGHSFHSVDHAGKDDKDQYITPQQAKSQLDRCVLAPETMTLKVGAQVMLIKNVVQGILVNGSVGKVTDFLTCHEAKEKHHIEVVLSPRDKEENPKTEEVRIAEHLWQNKTKWPVVEFPGDRKRLIPPHEFTIENADGSMQALRLPCRGSGSTSEGSSRRDRHTSPCLEPRHRKHSKS
ncbi:hypothetical protein BDM02DRAFT_1305111 [Thelephora ganbajun]|uniref:Uncharacterized protein n=1 Tax=Thelephora ganbajun TaxID=370292 RepID=A0ACB6ZMT9_THEGA|nr:hypothetical protein BDM02DRAFT_1305111 [Thelephora ganbajun]